MRSSEATADLDAEARAEAIGRAIGAATAAGKAGRDDLRGWISRGECARDCRRDEQRAVRLPPDDRRRLLGHRAHARRHGQRLGTRWRARLERGRSGGDWSRRGAKGRGEQEPSGNRARPLYRGARASGGHRSRFRCWPARSTRAMRTKAAARSRSREAARASARRWPTNGSRSTRIPPMPDLRGQPFDAEGLPDASHGLDREGHPEEPLLTRASGPRSRESSRPDLRSPAGLRSWAEPRAQRN